MAISFCAPDQGAYGQFYPTSFPVTSGFKDMPIIVFDCKATSIYDLVDPQTLNALSELSVYDADTNSAPRQFGTAMAVPEALNPHVEDMAVIFTEDTRRSGALAVGSSQQRKRIRLKLVMGAGASQNRLLLLNSVSGAPEGTGYDVTDGGTLDETAYKAAHDMWALDDNRLRLLEEKGVVNDGLNSLHATAKNYMDLADKAKQSLNYSVFDSYCRTAWGYEARAYPSVASTAQDVVNGVIFYLFLMLPFAFFCERLFFGFPNLWKQLLAFFMIFLAVFGVFEVVHPAFKIAGSNSLIVLVAFIMMALSFLVISIVVSKFEEQIKQFNRSIGGVHKADIGRISIAAAAFSLGISNMRRRKARTILTCTTLVLLTFTVLSFTSIVSALRFNKVPSARDATTHVYNGIMIRTADWESMQEIAYRMLKDEFGNGGGRRQAYPVAPRRGSTGPRRAKSHF